MVYLKCVLFISYIFSGGNAYITQWGRKSVENCDRYKYINHEAIVFPSIVGGTRAGEYEYPHMAALGYGNSSKWNWYCGGSLISDFFILTAAHCLYARFEGEVKIVRLGTKNVIHPEPTYRDYNISRRIQHPLYTARQRYNDIALLRLSNRVTFSDKIKPACLHITTDFVPCTMTATGWGSEAAGEPMSPYLLKVSLIPYNYTRCSGLYSNQKRSLPYGIDPLSMICAAGGQDEAKDTCFGDSGGPLQLTNDPYYGQYFIVGITSFSLSCGLPNIPTVYTRVSDYIGWIELNVWP